MRNRLPRDPEPALNRPVGFKSLKQARSDPFYLLLGLKFLLPCPRGPSAWHELHLAFLSTLPIRITLPTHLPIKGTKTARWVPGLFWKNPETQGHQGITYKLWLAVAQAQTLSDVPTDSNFHLFPNYPSCFG